MFVNGPSNLIRLSSTISEQKIIYFIMIDISRTIENETKCESYDSVDFLRYFDDALSQTKNTEYLVFFQHHLDMTNEDIIDNKKITKNLRLTYVHNIANYIINDVDVGEQMVMFKNLQSKKFDYTKYNFCNVCAKLGISRIFNINNNIEHILKLDNFFYYEKSNNSLLINLFNLRNEFIYLLNLICKYFNKNEYKNFSEIIIIDDHIIKTEVDKYYNIINESKYLNFDTIFKFDDAKTKKLILNSGLLKDFVNIMKANIKNLNKCILLSIEIKKLSSFDENKYNEQLEKYDNNEYGPDYLYIYKLAYKLKCKSFSLVKVFEPYYNLTNIYLLKSLIESNVNNNIVFTFPIGVFQCMKILIKYFNFKITNADYLKHDIDSSNKKFLNNVIVNDNENDNENDNDSTSINISEILKPIFSQCCDMTKFEKTFL